MSTENKNSDQNEGDGKAAGTAADATASAEDLALISTGLEDEAKDDEEIWDEIDASEKADGDADADAADKDDPDGEKPSGEDEAAAANAGAANAAAATGDKDAPAKDPDPDETLWDGASPKQRAAFDAAQAQVDKLSQYKRSNHGRVSTLQRQLNDITRQLDKGAGSAAPGDGKGDADAATNGFLDSEDWKGFASEYPEVAGPLGKVISGMQTEITTSKKQLNAIGNDRIDDAVAEQTVILEEQHPDWLETATDEGFGAWLDDQPRHIREAAVRNAKEIVDAAEAADVVGRFKAFRSEQSENSDSPENNQESPTDLAAKRKRQKESGSSARGKGAGAATGIPADGDETAIWDAFDKKEERERRQA